MSSLTRLSLSKRVLTEILQTDFQLHDQESCHPGLEPGDIGRGAHRLSTYYSVAPVESNLAFDVAAISSCFRTTLTVTAQARH